ncbi:NADH dehydrogenase [ubiquinone] 1 alpha subcomplex subunit 1 [Eurosta solidaginis]|uniref:NADH dehydrogenase [ubiquinone] 1 alpha subcomplex subunit 1 n=1 Tax=Eurosta solidaginis TaxID=178769 RepID=UPI0035312B7E
MWYEILPAAGIISVVLTVPIYAMWGLNKWTLGNGYRRNMDERFDRVLYQRDMRLTNNPYNQNGLDSIPDEKN